MQENSLISEYTKKRRGRAIWKNILTAMICIVVFVTTYALIIPAITQEKETFCGLEEHKHEETCYTAGDGEQICALEETEAHTHTEACWLSAHTHTDACYAESVQGEAHTHGADCYASEERMICGTEESAGHTHDASCYSEEVTELTCGQAESAGHTHGASCYSEEVTGLACDEPEAQTDEETEPHAHADSCYFTTGGDLVCGQAESAGHIHGASCYTTTGGDLICGQAASAGHTHGESCYETVETLICEQTESEATAELICGLEETPELVCGLEETAGHTHDETCGGLTGESELTCELEEHTHEKSCYADKSADIETAEIWERTMENVELTGVWADDLLAIAESQLGYKESTRNYIVTEDNETKGYTRFGDWYGDDYGDWCAMFVSFCLHYAEVDHELMPQHHNCAQWIEVLKQESYDLYRTAEDYVPVPGDLIFFDWNGDGESEHIGLVAELIAATETESAKVKTIEGNSSNQVKYNTYEINSPILLGYGVLPENPELEPELIESTLTATIYTDGSYETVSEDETVITVSGVMPQDAEVRAYPVELETELTVVLAYDIEIMLADGTVFEPDESLKVNIQNPELDAETDLQVYYVPDEGEPEEVTTEVTETGVNFETPHFSVYAVATADDGIAVAATGESIPTGTNANAYYHSTTYPFYQVSRQRFRKSDGRGYRAETYVLISMDEYGGSNWEPDSTTWTAAGNHNYVVAYCADFDHVVSDTGETEYRLKTPLSNTNFSAAQQKRLRFIIENSYPFITVEEMQAKLTAAGISRTYDASAMMYATQWAIWNTTNSQSFSIYDQASVSKSGILNPITTSSITNESYLKQIYNFLLNTEPVGALEIAETGWTANTDGTYTITATLNRAMVTGETITATLSDGSNTVTKVLDANSSEFTMIWDKALPENGNLTLSISGTRPAMDVYYYDDGGDVQNLISGEPSTEYEEDRVIVVGSLADVTVQKKWNGTATEPITVYLVQNGTRIETVTLSSDNNWTYTWENLPLRQDGMDVQYTVEEEVPDGYIPSVSTTSANGMITIVLTNTPIAESNQTHIDVSKVWEDADAVDHSGDSVTVQLYADGVYVKQLTLSAENNWQGTFDGLPYYRADGVTPIEYTVREVEVPGYTSEITMEDVEAESTISWPEESSLTAGETYRFVSGGYALAVDANGNLTAVAENPDDQKQWWIVGGSSNAYTFYNAASGKYLGFSTSTDTFSASESSTSFRFSSDRIYYYESGWLGSLNATNHYMVLSANGVSRTTSSGSATTFTIYHKVGTVSNPTYTVTVTNTPVEVPSYELPETGGAGTTIYTTVGMALAISGAAGLMYIRMKRKREVYDSP